jgi:hypothetical protein
MVGSGPGGGAIEAAGGGGAGVADGDRVAGAGDVANDVEPHWGREFGGGLDEVVVADGCFEGEQDIAAADLFGGQEQVGDVGGVDQGEGTTSGGLVVSAFL